MSLWELKVGVMEIYSSSQPRAYYFTQNPDELAKIIHEECYRKAN